MTVTLCGFALSNYVNKVKLVLLEKGLAFDEEFVGLAASLIDLLSASPLGKVPFLRTEHGTLCESIAIVEYLEAPPGEPVGSQQLLECPASDLRGDVRSVGGKRLDQRIRHGTV